MSLYQEKFTEGDDKQHELLGSTVSKPIPTEERQDETETGKESTKKLSAHAPPFSPSTTPVFGSVPVPGFKDHRGIPHRLIFLLWLQSTHVDNLISQQQQGFLWSTNIWRL